MDKNTDMCLAQLDRLSRQIEFVTLERDAANATKEALAKEVSEMSARLALLEKELAEKDARIAEKDAQLAEKDALIAAKDEALHVALQRDEALRAQVDIQERSHSQSTARDRARISELEAELRSARARSEELSQTAQTVVDLAEAKHKKLGFIKEKLEWREEQVKVLKEAKAAVEQREETLKAEVEAEKTKMVEVSQSRFLFGISG